MSDYWDPAQYGIFQNERAAPSYDLFKHINKNNISKVVDLGCGSGELTKVLHEATNAKSTLGIDSSQSMINQANELKGNNLSFIKEDIINFNPSYKFDLIVANASLQWAENHRELLPKIFSWLNIQGQIAIQMPYNHDQPVHTTAREVAIKLFPDTFNTQPRPINLLSLEDYSTVFYKNDFKKQLCEIKVYPKIMHSVDEIIEWTKGTLLTYYQKFLSEEDFLNFIKAYHFELESKLGKGKYFYPFKRILLWAQK